MELGGLALYGVALLTMAGLYALLTLSLNVQWGYAGLLNAGIAGFFAVGAYTSAVLTSPAVAGRLGGFSLPVPAGLIGAALFSALVGWAIARICVRLKGDYLAMASIGIAEILRLVATNEEWLTGGSRGVTNIPRPLVGGGQASDIVFLGAVWLLVLALYLAFERLNDSPWGRTLRAIRDNEAAARSLGKDVERFRLQAFVIGAAGMGLAGAMTAHYIRFFSPDATEPILVTFLAWVMLMIGGSGNNRGAILGALIIWTIWSATEILTNALPGEWATRAAYLRMFLIGLLVQVVLQRFPAGLLPQKNPELPFVREDQRKLRGG